MGRRKPKHEANGEAEKTDPDVRTEPYTTTLRISLTPEEIADRADRAAGLIEDRDRKEEEQKAATKHAKSIIEAIDAEIRKLSNEVRTRSTYGPVECERRLCYKARTLVEIRLDTGEEISSRNLTLAELQRELPYAEESKAAADADAKAAEASA